MNFAQAWTELAIDDRVTVSNGQAAPSNMGGTPYKIWMSHNFEGKLKEKTGAAPHRVMAFTLDADENGNILTWGVNEAADHSFAIV